MEKIIVNGYEVSLVWDADDSIFVATAVSLPGCMAHGSTQQEAAKEVAVAIRLHLATASNLGRPVPQPLKVYGIQLPA